MRNSRPPYPDQPPAPEPAPAAALDPTLQAFFSHYQEAEQARTKSALATLKHELFPRLKKWGVAKVHAEYSGYGDSGSINCIEYLDAQNKPVNMDLVRAASDPQLENVLYEFLPAGFETSDGGQGDVYLDISAGTVTLEHQENYTETRAGSSQWEV